MNSRRLAQVALHAVCVIALSPLTAGCARLVQATASASAVPSPDPRPHLRPHFRVEDIGTPGVPLPNGAQARWVLRIVTNPYWSRYLDDLWFEPIPSEHTPLLVFYAQETPSGTFTAAELGRPYQSFEVNYPIVGEYCGWVAWLFDDMPTVQYPPPGGDDRCYDKDPLSANGGDHDLTPPPNVHPPAPALLTLLRSQARIDRAP